MTHRANTFSSAAKRPPKPSNSSTQTHVTRSPASKRHVKRAPSSKRLRISKMTGQHTTKKTTTIKNKITPFSWLNNNMKMLLIIMKVSISRRRPRGSTSADHTRPKDPSNFSKRSNHSLVASIRMTMGAMSFRSLSRNHTIAFSVAKCINQLSERRRKHWKSSRR